MPSQYLNDYLCLLTSRIGKFVCWPLPLLCAEECLVSLCEGLLEMCYQGGPVFAVTRCVRSISYAGLNLQWQFRL